MSEELQNIQTVDLCYGVLPTKDEQEKPGGLVLIGVLPYIHIPGSLVVSG